MESLDFSPHGSRRDDWGTLADEKVSISSVLSTYSSEEKLHSFMKEEKYVDIRLRLDDGTEFSCHRCILASKSSYFDCLLSGGMRESKADVVPVIGISPRIMAATLDFIYTGSCSFKVNSMIRGTLNG
jgi:hypothetical protein